MGQKYLHRHKKNTMLKAISNSIGFNCVPGMLNPSNSHENVNRFCDLGGCVGCVLDLSKCMLHNELSITYLKIICHWVGFQGVVCMGAKCLLLHLDQYSWCSPCA